MCFRRRYLGIKVGISRASGEYALVLIAKRMVALLALMRNQRCLEEGETRYRSRLSRRNAEAARTWCADATERLG